MEQNPFDIIRSFAEDYLESNLDNLISFDLKKLMKDNVYGCPNRKFDADDTTIMRAIYCVVFGSVWPNLTMDNSGNEKMRGDTMNSSATFFLISVERQIHTDMESSSNSHKEDC